MRAHPIIMWMTLKHSTNITGFARALTFTLAITLALTAQPALAAKWFGKKDKTTAPKLPDVVVTGNELPLTSIQLEGNVKTRDSIILQELLFGAGDNPNEQDLRHSRQEIMNLGLFEKVRFLRHDDRLSIEIKEKKHDWYVLPRLNRSGDGDITLGVNWRANNLNGLNQKLKFTLAQKDYEQASRDKETWLEVKYVYPRIAGTFFSGSVFTTLTNVGIDEERHYEDGSSEAGVYDRNHYAFGFTLGRWMARKGSGKGLHVELGANVSRYDHDHISGDEGLFFDADIVGAMGQARWLNWEDRLYSRAGHITGLRADVSRESWGSITDFQHFQLYHKRYNPLGYRKHANFNYQITIASGDRSVFGEPIYSLEGGRSVRGIPREALEGDAYFLVNTEWLTPLFNRDHIRGGLLFDFGNAYRKLADIQDLEFEFGAGFALRWQLKSWVNTEIRLDAAKGFGDLGETKTYFSTNAFF